MCQLLTDKNRELEHSKVRDHTGGQFKVNFAQTASTDHSMCFKSRALKVAKKDY